jgi:hypothetical protein
LWAVLALAIAGAAGCGLPPTRVEFIETLSKENRQIARSTRAFRSAILPLKDGQAANAAQVRSGYDGMVKAVKQAKSDMAYQLLPPSSNSAKDLLDKYKAYLDGQDDILQNEMLQIVQEVELPTDDNGNPTPTDRWAVISPLLNQVSSKENETLGPLTQAQSAYCGEHNFQALGMDAYVQQLKSGK